MVAVVSGKGFAPNHTTWMVCVCVCAMQSTMDIRNWYTINTTMHEFTRFPSTNIVWPFPKWWVWNVSTGSLPFIGPNERYHLIERSNNSLISRSTHVSQLPALRHSRVWLWIVSTLTKISFLSGEKYRIRKDHNKKKHFNYIENKNKINKMKIMWPKPKCVSMNTKFYFSDLPFS